MDRAGVAGARRRRAWSTRPAARCCPASSTRTRTWCSRGSGRPSSPRGWRAAPTRPAASGPRSPRPAPRPTPSCAPGLRRLAGEMLRQGTTTFECKSGYGLTVDDEARCGGAGRRGHRRGHLPGRARGARRVRRRPGRLRRPGVRRRCWTPARRTAAGSTCSASAARSARTRPARCSRRAMARGLLPRIHASQLGPGPGIRLAVELGAASADHCTFLTDADVAALRLVGAPSPPCCPARSSAPGSPTRTPAACSTPA